MPRPKKKARDLTTEQAMKKLFPARVAEEMRHEAEKSKKRTPRNTGRKDNT